MASLVMQASHGCASAPHPCSHRPELDARATQLQLVLDKLQKKIEMKRSVHECNTALDEMSEWDQADPDMRATLAKVYCVRGATLGRLGSHDDAIADFTAAVRADPRCAPAFFNRAVAYKLQQRWVEVVADCTSVLALDPDNITARSLRACAAGRLGRFDQTVADCTAVIRRRPYDANCLRNRAAALMELKSWRESVVDLSLVITLEVGWSQCNHSMGAGLRTKSPWSGAAQGDRNSEQPPTRRGHTHCSNSPPQQRPKLPRAPTSMRRRSRSPSLGHPCRRRCPV